MPIAYTLFLCIAVVMLYIGKISANLRRKTESSLYAIEKVMKNLLLCAG